MASKNPNPPLYPEISQSNPESTSPFVSNPTTTSSSLYPSIDMSDIVQNLFPDDDEIVQNPNSYSPTVPSESVEELLVKIPGAIAHLIDKKNSVELASGDLSIVRLRQGESVVAVLVRVSDEIQWPLAKDEASVKLDDSHYFFSLRVPMDVNVSDSSDDEGHGVDGEGNLLNYGVTFAAKGQEALLRELDWVLENYSSFSVQKVLESSSVLDVSVEKGMGPAEMHKSKKNMEMMEEKSAAYWTTLAPNVEDYSGGVARVIAAGSGQLIKGILWCGDVTVDRLKWGDEFLKKRMSPCEKDTEVSPETLKRIKRVKRLSKMTEKVACGVLTGVVKVSGYFTSSVVNSKMGKKLFRMIPGEIVLASLDGFGKVCDAVEVAGKNVMGTTSVVTTGLVAHRHGEKAAEAANEGLDAAGHAIGTAWAVLKIRQALNPKSVIKPTTLTKAGLKATAAEIKSKVKK
ncbi:hypothetical protein Syun_005414 [Stephania yunnanensis]|uniref:Senescence domain-containing protein n=1 Tax=Stephania yunnanensis TaxID=152371 RepID=A0AAP0Q1Q5_9MAGN